MEGFYVRIRFNQLEVCSIGEMHVQLARSEILTATSDVMCGVRLALRKGNQILLTFVIV